MRAISRVIALIAASSALISAPEPVETYEQSVEVAYSVYDRLLHIHEAPLRNIRHSYWWIRKTFFTRSRSPVPSYVVSLSKRELQMLFGKRHFEPGWELSYHYHGEVLNLRRIEWRDHDDYNWWQVHIRGFNHDDGIELTAHFETEPSEHPDAHIGLEGLDVSTGMNEIKTILVEEGISYRRLEPSERPGIKDQDLETARR